MAKMPVGGFGAPTRDASPPVFAEERPTRSAASVRATVMGRGVRARHVEQAQPRVLGGRYLVLGELGRGAMGVVYRAYDKFVGREVAVKVLQTANIEAQAKLVDEARVMAKLSNPHVIAVYDVVPVDPECEHDGRVLVAMQYVQGQTLHAWLSAARSIDAILDVFRQAGRGLLAAHEAGIIHRDFKPTNVLIADDGRALVTDFGIAGRWAEEATALSNDRHRATVGGALVGTPWYMPPEQHLGLQLDPRADQYAFCVSLWEALARAPLFDEVTDVEMLLARKHEPLPPWPKPATVPPKVVRAVVRGLSRDPEARFASMAELLAALATREKHPRWFAVAGVASAAVVTGAFGWSWSSKRAQLCTGADDQLRGVWDAARRDEVRASLLATGVAYAPDTATRVAQELDRYANAWADEHRSACEATTLTREQQPEMMDLRMRCLHRAKIDLQAVTGLLAQADAQVLEKAQQIVSSLPSLEHCSDVEALRSDVPPPEPPDAKAVEAAQAELAQVKVLVEAGKYAEAQAAGVALAERADEIGYGPLQTEVLRLLGSAHRDAGAYAESERVLRQALRSGLRWRQLTLAHRAANDLVLVVGAAQHRAAEGLAYASTAEALLAFVGTREELALRNGVGTLYERQRRDAEAEATYRVALALPEAELRPDDVATVRFNLGTVLSNLGRSAEAEREQRAALEVFVEQLGPTHPNVAYARVNLGVSLEQQGRYAEAEQEYSAALASVLGTLGSEHPLVALCRRNLAGLSYLAGDYVRGEVEARAAVDLLRKLHGPEHVDVAMARTNLGVFLYELGRHAEAEAEHRDSLALLEKLLGTEHPLIAFALSNLGISLQGLGRHSEAEAALRAALNLRQQVLGSDHPEVAESHYSLASTLMQQGRLHEAEAEHRTGLSLRTTALGTSHPEVAKSRSGLADVLAEQRRFGEAEAMYREALAVQEQAFGGDHPVTLATRDGLERVRRAMGKRASAGR